VAAAHAAVLVGREQELERVLEQLRLRSRTELAIHVARLERERQSRAT
jgi:hypothetical protein